MLFDGKRYLAGRTEVLENIMIVDCGVTKLSVSKGPLSEISMILYINPT